MNSKIKSESTIVAELILGVLKLPFLLVLAVLGKKSYHEVFLPLLEFIRSLVKPRFTTTMILINSLLFFIMVIIGPDFFLQFVNYPSDFYTVRFYTLVTSGFLHANFLHLASNMVGLFIFGRIVEKELGSKKTAAIYFIAMIVASIVSSFVNGILFNSSVGGLGASGALMGLISTTILLKPFSLVYEFIIPIPIIVLGWLAIIGDITGVLSGVSDGIGHFAHLGGFFSIFLMMPFLNTNLVKRLKRGIWLNILTIVFLFAVYILYFSLG